MGKNIAIIFAGGVGARMGSGLPKQFIEVNGKPIIIHTLDIFEEHPHIDEIYVSCKEEYIRKLRKLADRHMISKIVKIVPGGATGLDSIYNALQAARENNTPDAVVLIHDGVRPCITKELIDEELENCTGLFQGKRRKELQAQSDRYAQTIKTMKQGLSHIVQDYKYPTVDAFLQDSGSSVFPAGGGARGPCAHAEGQSGV